MQTSLALLVAIASMHFASKPAVVNLVGLPREKITKLLGKPAASLTKNLKFGVIDVYADPKFYSLKFSFINVNGEMVPHDVRVTYAKKVSVSEALAGVGINPAGTTTHRSNQDGATVVDNAKNAPKGWRVGYWFEISKPNRTHLDFNLLQ
jgi:hypothetical protein